MPVRDGGPQPLSLRGSSSPADHVGRGPGLVDKDEPLRIKIDLLIEPILAPPQDVRTLLLRRVGGLFLNVRSRRSRKRQMAEMLNTRPCSARSALISSSVMSGVSLPARISGQTASTA